MNWLQNVIWFVCVGLALWIGSWGFVPEESWPGYKDETDKPKK